MTSKYCLVCCVVAVFATQLVACSSEFESCLERRACSPQGGAGARAGTGGAGDPSSNAGANPRSQGGSAGEAGAAEAGRVNEGGAADEMGVAGAGGAGGAVELDPALFGACSSRGEIVCDGHASAQRLACDGVKWQAGTTCAAGQLCDSTSGKCRDKVAECASALPGALVCRGADVPLTCGVDLVTASEGKACAGICKDGACQPAVCGDKKVQSGEDCDDGDATTTGACVKCKKATCGDGAVWAEHEQCDDKNQLPGDGCSPTCGAEPIALSLGSGSTCALSSTGVVKCWGYNVHGALGLGDTANRGDEPSEVPSKLPAVALGTNRVAKAISSSFSATCVLLDNGESKCWGENTEGQLGTGDKFDRGDGPGEMGDALKSVALGVGRTATGVSIGSGHACAVLDNGTVKCWGSGARGQLGQENSVDYLLPGSIEPIKLARSAKAVSAGLTSNTCALLDNGTAKCWGDRDYISAPASGDLDASLAIGDFPGEMSALPLLNWGAGLTATSIVAGPGTCAVLNEGTLKCWGANSDGLLGQPGGFLGSTSQELAILKGVDLGAGRKAKATAVSYDHACAVLDNGALKCWGYNGNGQLGIGSTGSKGSDFGDMGDALPPVYLGGRTALQVAVGGGHTCAILDDGTLKCWGANESGQLGLGDTRPRGDIGGRLSADTTVDLSF